MNSYLEKVYSTLSKLQDGWYNDDGLVYDREELSWLMHEFDMHFNLDLPKPFFYPSPTGTVLLEWLWHDWDITCEIDLKKQGGHYHALNTKTDNTVSTYLNFQKNGWMHLNDALEKIYK